MGTLNRGRGWILRRPLRMRRRRGSIACSPSASSPTTTGTDSMADRPEIVITPSAEQYRQLCRDLDALLAAGAESRTAAVVEAVRVAADQVRLDGSTKTAGRRSNAPGPTPGGRS